MERSSYAPFGPDQRSFKTDVNFSNTLLTHTCIKSVPEPFNLPFNTCGAILGRSGHHLILHMSTNWGGYSSRKPFFNSLFTLASANFSEVRSLNKKCRMKSIDIAAQLRNLGLMTDSMTRILAVCEC
jgi:hypothetical protein